MCPGSRPDPTGAHRLRTPHGCPDTRAPTSPQTGTRDLAAQQTQAGHGHTQTRTHRHRGARTQQGTAARRRASPEGTRTRAPGSAGPAAPRYLHVVDDGLEEPAQGAALLLRRLHARAGRRRGAGRAREPGRAGARSEAVGPAASGPRSGAVRAALRGRGPPRGGAGHVAAGLAGGAGGAARAAGGAAWARGLSGGGNPSRRASASRGRGGGRGERRGGRARREGAVGKAERAQAHSQPGSRALKSEPGAARLVGRAGPRGRGRHRGSGAAPARLPVGVGPVVGCPRPGRGSTPPSSLWSRARGGSRAFSRQAEGWGPPDASRGTDTPPTAGTHGVLGAVLLGTFHPRHRRVRTLLHKFFGSFSKRCRCH